MKLTTTDHSRASAGLTYVYPVLSRRSGGLSIGINLNPNNACNWRCIYCQVEDLRRGPAPTIDLARLRDELSRLLQDVQFGDFFQRYEVAVDQRKIRDIAISGNGEPTSAVEFPAVVDLIRESIERFELGDSVRRVLITNGSLFGRAEVQRGIARWAELGGEIWFKIDRATREGMARVNQVECPPERVARNLELAARLCPTWLQTCLFSIDGQAPDEPDQQAYLDFVGEQLRQGVPLRGIKLYGLARPSKQPEAPRLSALSEAWMASFAGRLRSLGIDVTVSV